MPSPGVLAVDGAAVAGVLIVAGMSVGVRGDAACCVYIEGAGQDVTGPVAGVFLKTLSG